MAKKRTENRGGAREGSGRRTREELGKAPRVAITLRLEPEVAEKFQQVAKAKAKSQAALFSEMVGRLRK